MQKMLAIAGIVCLLGAGWISADLISSSIKTDGTAWITSTLTEIRPIQGIIHQRPIRNQPGS